MAFFDKKSEVISVELTSYGKYLLSKGKFKPSYYEFLDNDIIYDSGYAGIEEERNNISNRIKNETPSLKPQYIFTGVETKLKQLLKLKNELQNQRKTAVKEEELIENSQVHEKLYVNSVPLGNSNLDDKYPALNFYLYNAEINSSKSYKKNNSHIIMVPELIIKNINYSSSINMADSADLLRLKNIEENQFSLDNQLSPQQGLINPSSGVKIFSDNTYISVEEKSVLLQIFEENVMDNSDNFEIEFFTYETGSKSEEIIKQLYFDKSEESMVNDPTKVEYYFDLTVDGNISKKDLEILKKKKQTVVFQQASPGKSIK